MGDFTSLIERIEAATEGSRELDVAVCLATSVICDSVTPSKVRNLRADPDDHGWVLYDYEGDDCTDSVREFTASIDAALTLLPEGYHYTIEPDSAWIRCMGKDDVEEFQCALLRRGGECTALALCAAILKARQTAAQPAKQAEAR